MIVGADDLAAHPKLVDQLERGGLGGEEAIGPALDDAALDGPGLNHAAEARPALDQRGSDAGLGQMIGRRKPRDAAADDRYTPHVRPPSASPEPHRPARR